LAVLQTGPDVAALQDFLILNGYLESGNNTGYFGVLTQTALIRYQQVMGIEPASGFLGPLTRASIAGTAPSSLAFMRDLSLGSRGEDVRSLQILLNSRGYAVAASGPGSISQETDYFGPATTAAVVRFQLANGIVPAVGFFGPITRAIVNR